MIERSIKGKFLVFSVFFLGLVSGVLLTTLWETRVASAVISADLTSADRDLNKFYNHIGLTPEQRRQVSRIMQDSKPELNRVFEQTHSLLERMKKQTRGQIRAVLSDHQKKKYDEFNQTISVRRNNQPTQHLN